MAVPAQQGRWGLRWLGQSGTTVPMSCIGSLTDALRMTHMAIGWRSRIKSRKKVWKMNAGEGGLNRVLRKLDLLGLGERHATAVAGN